MKLNTSELKATARGCLAGRYATIVIAYMLARFFTNLPTLLISYMPVSNTLIRDLIDISVGLIIAFIMTVFIVGQNRICLKYARSKDPLMVNEMWYGFKNLADQTIIAYFLIMIRMLIPSIPFITCMFFLSRDLANVFWMAASIITGILMFILITVIYLDYTLVFFLIIDYPDENPSQLLKKSKALMKGNRLKYLYLQASFLGMYLLGILSFGVGMLWVNPYVKMAVTKFYLLLIGEKNETEQLLEGKLEDPNYFKEVY